MRRAWLFALVPVLAFGLPGVAPAAAQVAARSQEPVINPTFDSLARSVVGRGTPGLALLVIHRGETLHRAAYGVTATDARGVPVDFDTPFYIASTAKMMTAAAVLRLVDEGRVGLDDPVARYVDAVPGYARGITVRQVLDHTSGLIDHYDVGGEGRTYSNPEVLEILEAAGALAFEPGTRASYSNSGYVLLTLLVEAASGRPFEAFLQETFFRPLGMDDAFVVTDPDARPADRAIGYQTTENGFQVDDYGSTTTGAGGVYASLSDLERWARALRRGELVSDSLLALASRPPPLPEGRLTPYGMGWLAEFASRGPLADRWYVFAAGMLQGHRSVFQWYREDDLIMVWLSNGTSPEVFEALRQIPALVL